MEAVKRFGAYEILGEIARGGQGSVVRARLESSGDLYALKLLMSRDPRARKRFLQEGKVLAGLSHPNLLRVTDLGEQSGVSYLAMELVAGQDLGRIVEASGIPSAEWSAKVLGTVAHALHYCHEQGIVHRDLKPANVLIEEGTDRPVLVDFGLIKRDPELMRLSSLDDGGKLSKTGELKGTPKYMAPEQAAPGKFGAVSRRTDVYALGATLYFLLTGRAPFEGASVVHVIAQVVRETPESPLSLNPQAPRELSDLCLRCLVKDPAGRPASAEAFAAELVAALELEAWLPSFAGHSPEPPAPPRPSPPLSSSDPTSLGLYEVVSLLGRGGMGAVYRSRHEVLGVERALKVLTTLRGPKRLQRFEREIKHLARLHHPNVVAIHESGHEGAWAWFAMDLVGGQPLDEVLAQGRPSYDRAIQITLGIARGIGALHRAGIVHRDVKPQNVVLQPNGTPVVLDLGLAIAPDMDDRLTRTGAIVGTPFYMAPEQLKGEPADASADVYALGLLFFELVSGRRALQGDNVQQVLGAVLSDSVPTPSSVDPDLPRGVDTLCAQALARDPSQRPANADAFAELLIDLTRRPGRSRRTRHRLALAACGLGVACAITAWALGGGEGKPTPTDPEENGQEPIVETTPPPDQGLRELTPRQVRDGDRRLAKLLREPRPEARCRAARDWLDAFPGHPRAADAERTVREARIKFPARVWAKEFRGVVLDSARVLTWKMELPDTIKLWSVESGEEVGRLELPGQVLVVAVAPDRQSFAVGGVGPAVLWIKASTREVLATFDVGIPMVDALAFSPTENLLAVAGFADTGATSGFELKLLNLGTGDVHSQLPVRGYVQDVAFSPDGTRLVAAGGDAILGAMTMRSASETYNGLWIFRTEDGELIAEERLTSAVKSVCFAPDGETFAGGTNGGGLYLYRARDGVRIRSFVGDRGFRRDGAPMLLRSAHNGAVRGVAFSADGARLYSSCGDNDAGVDVGALSVWEVGGRRIREEPDLKPISDLELSPDGEWLLLSTLKSGVQLWPTR